jgi:hypothetical protein
MIAYVLYEISRSGEVWSSRPETFEARERYHVVRAVDDAWFSGRARWAEGLDGTFIYGRSATGAIVTARPPVPESVS